MPYARIATASGKQVNIKLEIADTPSTRETGLMNRNSLPADSGMLFVFPSDILAAFWMRNTLIPLSIAFISADGTIINIQDMQPLSESLHAPATMYRYALEANLGFFKDNGVIAGDRAEFQLGGR
jgi:uncharacterized membrane protein (UPF0127 family)